MGYSARYHAASLAAVFLALAVGILIGVGFGSDIVSGTADELEQSLESDLEDARAQISALEADLDEERAFEAAVYPAIVDGELPRERIAVIGLGGLSGELTDDIEQAIGPSGAAVTEAGVVTLPPNRDALAGLVDGRRGRAVSRGEAEALRELAADAGRTIVRGGGEFDALRGTLFGRFSGSSQRVDAVVVVRERPSDLGPKDAAATDAVEQGLIAGFRSVGQPGAVGAELEATDPSNVGFFEAEGISSVDSIDLLSGKVALVFALAGADGSFGVKETADSLLPDLLASPERSGRGDRGGGGDRR
jgi:hypothetical protein